MEFHYLLATLLWRWTQNVSWLFDYTSKTVYFRYFSEPSVIQQWFINLMIHSDQQAQSTRREMERKNMQWKFIILAIKKNNNIIAHSYQTSLDTKLSVSISAPNTSLYSDLNQKDVSRKAGEVVFHSKKYKTPQKKAICWTEHN